MTEIRTNPAQPAAGNAQICPRCGNVLTGWPAISKYDGRTKICGRCAGHEDRLLARYGARYKELDRPVWCTDPGAAPGHTMSHAEALRTLAATLADLAIEDAAASELIQVEADSAIETILAFADLGDLLRLIAWAEAEGVTVNMYLEDLACMAYEGREWPEAVKTAMSARRRCEEPRTGEEGEADA